MKSFVLPTLLLGLAMATPRQDVPFEFPEDPNLRVEEEVIVESVPERRRMLEEVGIWNATVRSFIAPGMPPVESKGILTSEMFGDGWLVSNFVGSVLGEKLRFRRTVGFDPDRKRATGVLIDPNASQIAILDGIYDMNTRKRTLTYVLTDFAGKTTKFKSVEKTLDAENRRFHLFEVKESNEEVPVLLIDFVLVAR